MKTNKLVLLRKKIEDEKKTVNLLKNYKKLLLKQTGCKTMEEAKEKLEMIKREIKFLQSK
jgi:hypothetical protein